MTDKTDTTLNPYVEERAKQLYEQDGFMLAIYERDESWVKDRENVRERYRKRAHVSGHRMDAEPGETGMTRESDTTDPLGGNSERYHALNRIVNGALRCAANSHAEIIFGGYLGSISKRVVSEVLSNWDRLAGMADD